MSCTNNGCEIHKNEKQGGGYLPKTLRSGRRGRKRRERSRIVLQHQIRHMRKAGLALDISYLSENHSPFPISETIQATAPMASQAFSPLYSQAGSDSDEATNAHQRLSTLQSCPMCILTWQVRHALNIDVLYTRVKQTNIKLHYSFYDGLLLAQNTNGYENLHIPIRPREMGVCQRGFIRTTIDEGHGHFSACKWYSYPSSFS